MFGDRGIAHHAIGGEGFVARQIGQPSAGDRLCFVSIEQGDGSTGFAFMLPVGQ
ncbi:hypothetical protein D3C78_1990900 [compost metagenome]